MNKALDPTVEHMLDVDDHFYIDTGPSSKKVAYNHMQKAALAKIHSESKKEKRLKKIKGLVSFNLSSDY